MIAEKLRKSILQAAIRGKLTEQLSDDGDARELLAEIKAEKARLVKEGKIKKEKPLPEITEEEIPFDIPDNWCWVRLGEIFNISTGMTPLKSERKYYANGNIPWVTSTLTSNEYIYQAEFFITVCALKETRLKIFPVGTLILAMYGQGKTRGQISELGVPCTINQACAALEEIYPNIILRKYVKSFHLYNYNSIRSLSEGTAQPNLNLTKVKETILPLPPIEEQQRIIEAIERALEKTEDLEKDEMKLELLQKSFPKKMKDSLLQAAIQGKLTEQLEADGDARTLVADIQKEKARLIKEGKIKKGKALPEITEEEIPFEIPDNWCWVRLGDLSIVINGDRGKNYPGKSFWISEGVPFINAGALNNDVLNSEGFNYISEKRFLMLRDGFVEKNDILYCLRGSLGKFSLNLDYHQGAIASSLAIIRNVNSELCRYFITYLNSPVAAEMVKRVNNGTAQPNLSADNVKKYIIPLPPLAEQQRIVERLEQLLPLCDTLE